MASSPSLPPPDAVARLLRDLFDKGVAPKKGAAMPAATKVCTGTYVDDAGKLVGLCLCDLPLSASAGAALALMPPRAAADAVKAGQLPVEMFENVSEVLNVMASLFGGIHVRLREVLPPSTALPAPIAALAARPSARLDLELTVAGYTGGKLSLLVG